MLKDGRKANEQNRNSEIFSWIFALGVLVSFCIWIISIFKVGADSDQYNIFFVKCGDFFADALNVIGYTGERDVYHNMVYTGLSEKAYPPFAYLLLYPFSKLINIEAYYQQGYFLNMYQEPRFLIIYFIIMCIQLVFFYELFRSAKQGSNAVRVAVSVSLLLSAPVLFAIERGNLILITMGLVVFYCACYNSKDLIMRELAFVALAVAAAIKCTPAIFGVMLLIEKRWFAATRTYLYGIAFCFLPFFFFKGGLQNVMQLITNIQLQFQAYAGNEGCTISSSINIFLRRSLGIGSLPDEKYQWIVITVGFFLIVSFCISKKKWEKLLAVSLFAVVMPSHSEYYNILLLIPAILALLNENEHTRSDYVILVGIIFLMQDIQGDIQYRFLNYHNCLLLLIFVTIIKCIFALSGIIKKKVKRMRLGS